MAFRFLHAADLHLDAPFVGVSASAAEVAGVLRDASIEAFDNLVRVAIARDVALVVVAGGLYRGSIHGVRAQRELRRGFVELADRGIQVLVALGPDDPIDEGWTAVRGWPDLVTFFPPDAPLVVSVEREGSVVATVHGISHGPRSSSTDDLAARIERGDAPGVHIAVVCGTAVGDGLEAPEADTATPCALEHLVGSGIDYWALGQRHERTIVHSEPWVVHPGTTQSRRLGPHDIGPKGAYLVEVSDDGIIADPEFVSLERVRFHRVEHSIDGVAALSVLRDRLVERGRACLAEADGRSLLLQVELVGQGRVHDELHRPGALAETLDALRSEAVSEAPLVWFDRFEVRTAPVRDLDELQGRNDFVADLVAETATLLADDEVREARVDGWDEDLPSDLAHLLEGEPPAATDPRRWQHAQQLAIQLVVGDES